MPIKLTKPTQCRFHPETERRIKDVAARFRVRPASLIRYAVDQQLGVIEREGRIMIEHPPVTR